ncbi:MAG: glycosyltransferase [Candidatus Moranbacteria bacterium]|nr:glycosyltransferase [Candidatus Moranbacteria bacterium]
MDSTKQNPKNILMATRPICLPWDEASKNFAWELSKRLNSSKRRFHLLTYRHLPYTFLNIFEHSIYKNPSLQLSNKEKLRLLKFLLFNNQKLDILHFLFTPSPLTTKIIKKLILPRYKFGRKESEAVKTIQTVATLNFQAIGRENVRDYLFADQIITHSKSTKKSLNKLGLKNVTHIYPGIDVQKFKSQPKSKFLQKKLGISYRDRVILYTGEYLRLEAVDIIVKAFQILSPKFNNLKLILACRIKSSEDESKKEEVDLRFKKLGLSQKVIYLETFGEIDKLYNLSSIFIFPVKKMTGKFDIALTILEAMACEIPTIIADTGALKEVVQEKDAAIILKEKTANELADQIKNILINRSLEAKLKTKARKNIENHFNINECVKKYRKIYDKI